MLTLLLYLLLGTATFSFGNTCFYPIGFATDNCTIAIADTDTITPPDMGSLRDHHQNLLHRCNCSHPIGKEYSACTNSNAAFETDRNRFSESTTSRSNNYIIKSQYGNLAECDTMSRGPFLLWWDKDLPLSDAAGALDKMMSYRAECINELGMQDPPNAQAGAYVNIYAYQSNDYFSTVGITGGCSVGTEQYGTRYRGPYMACSAGIIQGLGNTRAHETFHFYQYAQTSPGFLYSGNSQWYTEASATYYGLLKYPDANIGYSGAIALKRVPHVPLWLSFQNIEASSYTHNWQRGVHQYSIHLLLLYMSKEKNVPFTVFTEGYYDGTNLLPQEYIASRIGINNFRNYFTDFETMMHDDWSFLTPAQLQGAYDSWNVSADKSDNNEYILTLNEPETNGWYRPPTDKVTTGWSSNAYKITNSKAGLYTFQVEGDATGSYGDASHFKAKVLVRNKSGANTIHDISLSNNRTGAISIDIAASDHEIYLVITSVPDKMRDDRVEFQTYSYRVNIKDDSCINFDASLVGTACDDGDVCTTDETYDSNCNCVGTIQDADNDGICDGQDPCPTVSSDKVWSACDDGNPCTATSIYYNCDCKAVTNFALEGTVSMSSTLFGINKLNDGVINDENNDLAHTNDSSPNEWIEIDLGTIQEIESIVIWNRTNCCGSRLNNAYVFVADSPFPTGTDVNASLANADFTYQIGDVAITSVVGMDVNVSGRYVRIQKSGTNIGGDYLNLKEVQVFGADPNCVEASSKLLAKVFLEGFYDGPTGQMHRQLPANNLLPLTQPFNTAPWNYTGNETVSSIPANVTDWILVVSRTADGTPLSQAAGFITQTGELLSPDGTKGIALDQVIGNHFSIHHRSHLAIISAQPYEGSMMDFTVAANLAKGNESMKNVNGRLCLYAGDYDATGIINATDFNNWKVNGAALNQYLPIDGDGNGIINASDYNLWINNRSKVGEPRVRY